MSEGRRGVSTGFRRLLPTTLTTAFWFLSLTGFEILQIHLDCFSFEFRFRQTLIHVTTGLLQLSKGIGPTPLAYGACYTVLIVPNRIVNSLVIQWYLAIGLAAYFVIWRTKISRPWLDIISMSNAACNKINWGLEPAHWKQYLLRTAGPFLTCKLGGPQPPQSYCIAPLVIRCGPPKSVISRQELNSPHGHDLRPIPVQQSQVIQ